LEPVHRAIRTPRWRELFCGRPTASPPGGAGGPTRRVSCLRLVEQSWRSSARKSLSARRTPSASRPRGSDELHAPPLKLGQRHAHSRRLTPSAARRWPAPAAARPPGTAPSTAGAGALAKAPMLDDVPDGVGQQLLLRGGGRYSFMNLQKFPETIDGIPGILTPSSPSRAGRSAHLAHAGPMSTTRGVRQRPAVRRQALTPEGLGRRGRVATSGLLPWRPRARRCPCASRVGGASSPARKASARAPGGRRGCPPPLTAHGPGAGAEVASVVAFGVRSRRQPPRRALSTTRAGSTARRRRARRSWSRNRLVILHLFRATRRCRPRACSSPGRIDAGDVDPVRCRREANCCLCAPRGGAVDAPV
jgi:hypothetical protein